MARLASFLILLYLAQMVFSGYVVTFRRVNMQNPVISSQDGMSIFKWNYNAAVVPSQVPFLGFGLMVRCQNQSNVNDPYSVTPSMLSYTPIVGAWDENKVQFAPIGSDNIVFSPTGPSENFGTEDPRIVYRDKTQEYYMLYSAVQQYSNGTVMSRLSLAVSSIPYLSESWKRYGPIIPSESWSKSGAMLIRDGFPGPHYLIFGDSTLYPGLQVATSPDLLNWTVEPGLLITTRPNSFDSDLVEAGPMPLPLSDGNYLFIYNSARPGYPSNKPDWDLQYNVGWVVLDKDTPTEILQRSEEPLISPELGWETGDSPYLDLTPNVVFLEGWIPYGNNSFVVFYGGADSVVGVGIVDVQLN